MKKTKEKFDPFKNLVLDAYEQDLNDSIERDEWVSAPDFEERKKEFIEMAKNTIEMRKAKRITVRLNQGDLIKLKAKALEKNVPYQTLLGILVRDYVNGGYKVKL